MTNWTKRESARPGVHHLSMREAEESVRQARSPRPRSGPVDETRADPLVMAAALELADGDEGRIVVQSNGPGKPPDLIVLNKTRTRKPS
jgi:hypothetical protein